MLVGGSEFVLHALVMLQVSKLFPLFFNIYIIFSITAKYIIKSYQDIHLNDEPMSVYTIYKPGSTRLMLQL